MSSFSEWNETNYLRWKKYSKTTHTCEAVRRAKIFIATRPMTSEQTNDNDFEENKYDLVSQFFLKEAWLSKTNESVPDIYVTATLLLKDLTITTTVILCEFGESQEDQIYLARQRGSKNLFLFRKTDETDETDKYTKLNLLAIAMNYVKLNKVTRKNGIESVVLEYIFRKYISIKYLHYRNSLKTR